jgi:hypothetical protein
MATNVYTFKIRGLTSGSATIATKDVTIDSDGMLRWSDTNGDPRALRLTGDVAQLMKDIFTGASGIDSDFKLMV